MNVTEQNLETQIANLQQQLDEANRRIKELEAESDVWKARAEAAERKLADLVEKILKSNASPWNPDAVVTALLDLKTEALAQVEHASKANFTDSEMSKNIESKFYSEQQPEGKQ